MILLEFPAVCADGDPYRHVFRLEDIREIIEFGDGATGIRVVHRRREIVVQVPFQEVMARIHGVFQELRQQNQHGPPSILVPTLRNGR